jgi:hypothetical protein
LRRSPGLPDGIFSNQKSKFGQILEGLAMADALVFYVRLNILKPFGIFYVNLVYFKIIWFIFHRFGMLKPKIWQPCLSLPAYVQKSAVHTLRRSFL